MKKSLFLMSLLLGLTVSGMIFTSCGDDEVEPNGGGSQGKNAEQNTTDVAVSGSVGEVGAFYANISGVVNIDLIASSYSSVEVGVDVSATEDFANKKRFKATDVVGRKFTIHASILQPETKFYYRTYVSVWSLSYDYYGETYTFNTGKPASDFVSLGDVKYSARYERLTISGKWNSLSLRDEGGSATQGIEISKSSDFSGSKVLNKDGTFTEWSFQFDNVDRGTTYYYRSYARVRLYPKTITIVSEAKTYTTGDLTDGSGSIGGRAYVDLGLPSGTLWATMNVGASKPEDYGSYYAWGETEPYDENGKTTFDWSTYKWCNGSSTLTKYCNESISGTVDNKTELDLEDDAAYVNWGSSWRMPSEAQFDELLNSSYTTREWTSVNGVYGIKVTGKRLENTIFLPAAGYRRDTSLIGAGSNVNYWSRTRRTDYPYLAWYLDFGDSGVYTNLYYRCYGRSVRPVRAQ